MDETSTDSRRRAETYAPPRNAELDRLSKAIDLFGARDFHIEEVSRFDAVVACVRDDDLPVGFIVALDRIPGARFDDEHLVAFADHLLVSFAHDLHFVFDHLRGTFFFDRSAETLAFGGVGARSLREARYVDFLGLDFAHERETLSVISIGFARESDDEVRRERPVVEH